MKKTIHVIPHSHWDFEWYFTVYESSIQLIYHFDEIFTALENNIINNYMLDGQLSIIEDYFIYCKENKQRVINLVKQEKLIIGPWYTQPDELIIRGESIVKNLEIGIDLSSKLGGGMKVGYLPDSFGQSMDMPKIYNGFNLHSAVFWRGVSLNVAKNREFYWQSEDGSEVLVYNLKNGYYLGSDIADSSDYESLFAKITTHTISNNIVLPAGGDQRYVDFNLQDQIDLFNNLQNNYFLKISTYENLFREICQENLELEKIQGELLSPSDSKIHRSIYSNRYDHKYMNDKIERRLIYTLEPLMVMTTMLGIPEKRNAIDEIWKLLLRNHAHDSAGGCNSDKTNEVILSRYKQADQLSYSMTDYLVRKISESRKTINTNEIIVFNTLPFSINKIITLNIDTKNSSFELFFNNKKLDFVTISQQKIYGGSIVEDVKDQDEKLYYYNTKITIELSFEAISYLMINVVEKDEKNKFLIPMSKNISNEIENDFYKVVYNGKTLIVISKKLNLSYEIYLRNSGDAGDNYDYSPPKNDQVYLSKFENASVVTKSSKITNLLELIGSFTLPYDLKCRELNQPNSNLEYKLLVTLNKNDIPSFTLEINNNICDHKMQVVIKSSIINPLYSTANTLFGTIKRPLQEEELLTWRELGWKEEPSPIYPLIDMINIKDKSQSLTCFTKGIKEYEVVGNNYNSIALTLYRCVGFLGKPNLLRRPSIASGNQFKYIETPDSQLQKTLKFKWGLSINEKFSPTLEYQEYLKYISCFYNYQIQYLNFFTNTLKYFVSNKLPLNLNNNYNLINNMNISVNFSILKLSKDTKNLIIRFYNPTEQQIKNAGTLDFKLKTTTIYEVNLNEDILSIISNSNILELGNFKAKQIRTFKIMV